MGRHVPLSILDLSPISSGSSASVALGNTLDLARTADRLGYRRYWVAEHHFCSGLAASVPCVLVAAVASVTRRMRIGSGGVLLGHRTALDVAEQFGTLEALYPGRIDLGVGRSGHRGTLPPILTAATVERPSGPLRVPKPSPPSPTAVAASPQVSYQPLLNLPGARPEPFGDQVRTIQELLAGQHRVSGDAPVPVVAASAGLPELWILGSAAGESARLAGEAGLPFAASFHVTPSTAPEAVETYRAHFRPSVRLPHPKVLLSVDVVVGPNERAAQALAAGFPLWLWNIRQGRGAPPYPSPYEVETHPWDEQAQLLVADRVATQVVGSPRQVVERLEALQAATGADELMVTTITHDHRDRVRSYELLAEHWG